MDERAADAESVAGREVEHPGVEVDPVGSSDQPRPVEHQTAARLGDVSESGPEGHLARNGTVIPKFWINVSKEELRRRFLDRIRVQRKNWKFSEPNAAERGHWDAYMRAYEQASCATSRSWAPWYATPADSKPFMRLTVAETLLATLESMGLEYPELAPTRRRAWDR